MSEKKEPKRIRIWVNKVEYDKIDAHAKMKGIPGGNRIIDVLMSEYLKKEDL